MTKPDPEADKPEAAAEPEAEAPDAAEPEAETADAVADDAAGESADADVAETDAVEEAEEPSLERQLAERTADLQRLQAEYVNYKKRVDRDREAIRDNSVASVITLLLPVLDDIGRAREHGELEGGFKAIGESVEQLARSFGLESFGENGEPFDPLVHEAMMYANSEDVEAPTADQVLQVGYRIGERVLRPARVSVVAPQE